MHRSFLVWAAESADLAEHLAAMRGGEELRQRGLHFVAEINVHTRARVSFLFHSGRRFKRLGETRANRNLTLWEWSMCREVAPSVAGLASLKKRR